MSDLSIPGVTSKYNTDKTIKALVETERIPLQRLESERTVLQDQKNVWLRLNQKMTAVREGARELYGFQNPFNNKIAKSSDESILTATASRTAAEEELSIQVKQIATADRFLSRSLPRDFKAPAGLYRFKVGNEELKIDFRGGSLKELAAAINAKGGNLLAASVVEDTPNTQVIVIESKKTGSKYPLTFHDQAAAFAEQAGLLERSPTASRTLPINKETVSAWSKPLPAEGLKISEGVLSLGPGTEARLPFRPPVALSGSMVLSFEIRSLLIPEQPYQKPTPPPGPGLPEVGGIEYGGIQVQSARSHTPLPEWKPPEPPQRIDDPVVLFAESRVQSLPLAPVKDSDQFYTVELGPQDLPAQLEALALRNRNTNRTIEIRNIRVYDKTARGDYRPAHPLSSAGDAKIVLEGVEVTRPENTVTDLVPGVTLNLKGAGDKPVALGIRKDLETIKSSLIRFFGTYNDLLTQVDILTRKDEAVIQDAQYLNDAEREQARKELGLFTGNVTLMQMKSRLQRIMMDPYPTAGGRELALLAQIGVTTSGGTFQTTGVLDKSKLRGYLQLDETKLEQALARNAEWVKQLFGNDTNKDLAVDSGVAFSTDTYLGPYVATGGIVANRVSGLNDSLARKSREIEAYNRHLADYEKELRRKFGIMESALDSLEQSSKTIENFNKRQE
jgi:flagellar hook-associated protein 2